MPFFNHQIFPLMETKSTRNLIIPSLLILVVLSLSFDRGTSYISTSGRNSVGIDAFRLSNGAGKYQNVEQNALSFLAQKVTTFSDDRTKRKTFQLMGSPEDEGETTTIDDKPTSESDLTEEDWTILSRIVEESKRATDDNDTDLSTALERAFETALPSMPPRLTLRIRRAADGDFVNDNEQPLTDEQWELLRVTAAALSKFLDRGLQAGANLLSDLLEAGEVRKLDGLIGKAAREGKLDLAFFSVVNMNLVDAAEEEKERLTKLKAESEAKGEGPPPPEAGVVSRYQILQHVYTRCQEEVEKTVDPAAALLNKLLRTDMDSIRKNQLKHYLVPEVNTVVAADGSEVTLPGVKALVPPEDLVKAMGDAVKQVRTVENSGGTDKATAAGLVESIRQLAIEARMVIAEGYGADNEVLKNFEQGLQPVFRPTSAESEYIKGNE